MSKKLPTTDRKNINRPPTWADIINICFQKKEHFVFNLTVSSRKYVTSLNLWLIRERISFFCCWYRYIATANIKINLRCYRLYKFYWKVKGEKTERFLLRLILTENSFPFNVKNYQYQPTLPRWAQRQQFPFQHFHGTYWNTKFKQNRL